MSAHTEPRSRTAEAFYLAAAITAAVFGEWVAAALALLLLLLCVAVEAVGDYRYRRDLR